MRWCQVKSFIRETKKGVVRRKPSRPTFVWEKTAFHARDWAAAFFGVDRQSIKVVEVKERPFMKGAVELIRDETGAIEERPLPEQCPACDAVSRQVDQLEAELKRLRDGAKAKK